MDTVLLFGSAWIRIDLDPDPPTYALMFYDLFRIQSRMDPHRYGSLDPEPIGIELKAGSGSALKPRRIHNSDVAGPYHSHRGPDPVFYVDPCPLFGSCRAVNLNFYLIERDTLF
jgi:hypothetical protein